MARAALRPKPARVNAFLLLALAALLVKLAARWPILALAAVPAAALAGTTLPDFDMSLGLGHRSGLTHSMVPVALACWNRRWWPLAAGLALGVGLHLSADTFPNSMRGFATVKLPGAGSIGGGASYLWLGANALAALVTGTLLLRRIAPPVAAAILLVIVAAIGIGYLFVTDGGWPALLVLGGAGWAITRRR